MPQREAYFHSDLGGDTGQTPEKSSGWRSKESERTCQLDVCRLRALQYDEDSIEVTLGNCFLEEERPLFLWETV